MPLVEPTLNMQTPASVTMGFTHLLVDESGKDTDSFMHTYWFIHMHVNCHTHKHTITQSHSHNHTNAMNTPTGIRCFSDVTLMV